MWRFGHIKADVGWGNVGYAQPQPAQYEQHPYARHHVRHYFAKGRTHGIFYESGGVH